jgi:phosphate transport system protein
MQRHFVQELEALKTNLIRMASLAEQAVHESIRAMVERNAELARGVIASEDRINALELENDEAIVDLLALQQPVASDLRFILSGLKINNDLERIGDHAVNIAESAISYSNGPKLAVQLELSRMGQIAETMLRETIDGFIHGNPALGREVLRNDDVIDDLNRQTVRDLVHVIRTDPEAVEQALELVRVSRNLERIADLATNIAEEVIYFAEAHVVKHHLEEKTSSPSDHD